MGDTQKSPTISTANQGIAAKVADDASQGLGDPTGDGPPLLVGELSLGNQCLYPEADGLKIAVLRKSRADLALRPLLTSTLSVEFLAGINDSKI